MFAVSNGTSYIVIQCFEVLKKKSTWEFSETDGTFVFGKFPVLFISNSKSAKIKEVVDGLSL